MEKPVKKQVISKMLTFEGKNGTLRERITE